MPQLKPQHAAKTANLLTLVALALAAGCHSAFVQATVVNHSGHTIRLFEVDYPFASFGGQDLADGATFHYRFKILGDGPSKLIWTDAAEHDHTSAGPKMEEGQEGPLTVTIGPAAATWDSGLRKAR
jgi:hypothetical protein